MNIRTIENEMYMSILYLFSLLFRKAAYMLLETCTNAQLWMMAQLCASFMDSSMDHYAYPNPQCYVEACMPFLLGCASVHLLNSLQMGSSFYNTFYDW